MRLYIYKGAVRNRRAGSIGGWRGRAATRLWKADLK